MAEWRIQSGENVPASELVPRLAPLGLEGDWQWGVVVSAPSSAGWTPCPGAGGLQLLLSWGRGSTGSSGRF